MRTVKNRDRSDVRGSGRKTRDFGVKFRNKNHGDGRKERARRAARDRRLWD